MAVIKKRGRPAGSKNKPAEHKRVLQPKVTVLSVRREWEQKYKELADKYAALAQAHIDLAQRADQHYAAEQALLKTANDRLVEIHRHQGVIIYLENKLGE